LPGFVGLPDFLPLAVPAGLVAVPGDADVLGLPLAPALEEPLDGALLDDGAELLADCDALLLAGALLVAGALLLVDALLLAATLLLALLDEALRLREELLPADEVVPPVETEPTGASEVGVVVGLAGAGLLESLATACPGSREGLLSAGWRTIRNPPVARAATSNAAAAASGPRPPNGLRRCGSSNGVCGSEG
jgi:hypothetical protein